MGWNYAMQWLVVLPLEIVAATITIEFWNDGAVHNDAWVALFLALIIGINLFGVKGYGEAEFIFSIIKVTAVIGFIILGIILNGTSCLVSCHLEGMLIFPSSRRRTRRQLHWRQILARPWGL